MPQYILGVDISKDHLDIHRLPDEAFARFTNNIEGFQALRRWLDNLEVVRMVYEPTGAYQRYFEIAFAPDFPLVKVNPWQARKYAQSRIQRAKTDRVDAQMLADMGRRFELMATAQMTETLRQIKELQIARMALIKDRTAALNRQKHLLQAFLKRQNAARLRHIKSQLAALDAEMQRLLALMTV